MRKVVSLSVIIVLAIAVSAALSAHAIHVAVSSSDPCDAYGDCLSSSITYVRSNPDYSLYTGDQFSVSLTSVPGSGPTWSGSLVGVAWSYDITLFAANATALTADFVVLGNVTRSYTVSATASFLVAITTCTTSSSGTTCTISYVQSRVIVSEQVSLRAFVLDFKTPLINATTPLHQTRRNPDGTFYPYDAFYVNYTYSFQFMQQRPDIKVFVAPSYDHGALNLASYKNSTSTGYFFFQLDNKTGSYSVTTTAKAFDWLNQLLGRRTTATPFQEIPLVISFPTKMLNITASSPLLPKSGWLILRNPDGSFFSNDSFAVGWNAPFKFSDFRPDIRINVTSVNPTYLKTVNLTSDRLGRNGTFTYRIGANATYRPCSLVLRAEAFNYYNDSLALTASTQPYVVVQYRPSFTYFTYMLYNSKNPSTYQRPFVTLVRYDGNDPGYSYSGDLNTAAFKQGNSTGERAWINNFTFSTQGWNTTVRFVNASIGQDVRFAGYPTFMSYSYLNKTYPMITWGDRVQKYYLQGNLTDFKRYASDGMIYYNLTESAWSTEFAGASRQWLFNTTYLYEPVQYNGYLTFRFYDASGKPDLSANVTITAQNPSPLNAYLIGRVESTFGNDSSVLKAFEKDLYPSNSTMILKQLQPNLNGTVTYLVNQTNLATMGASTFPSFKITVSSELSGTSYQFVTQPPSLTRATTTPCTTTYLPWLTYKEFSYDVLDRFSLFLVNGSALPSLPFDNATAYYLDPLYENLVLPVNSTLSQGPIDYVNWWAASPVGAIINPDLPITQEPGQLTNLYRFIYGQNSTVYVNTEGGGIGLLPPVSQGSKYQLTFAINPESGGVTRLWAVDSEGTTLTNMSLYPTTPSITSFSPPGYLGLFTAAIPVVHNGTMTVTLVNAWGAKTTIAGIPVMVIVPPQPLLSWNFVILITIILLGIGALASLLGWREARRKET